MDTRNPASTSLNAGDEEMELQKQDSEDTAESPVGKKVFYYGCGPWHPKWLQVLATDKFYTFILSIFVLVEGAITAGFVSTLLSTVERRYHFSSTAAGLVPSIYEITVTLVVVFVGYFGGRGHSAKWLGMGCVLQGIGCLIFMSPQFIFFNNTPPEAANNRFQVCSTNATEVACNSSNVVAYVLILLGQVVIGLGASTLYSVGITYLDELVHPKYISFHLAIIYVIQVLGPAIGYVLGGFFLSIYVDPWVSTNLTETDTNFVGAWWLSLLICGVLSLLISIPFFFYPRRLKNFDQVAKARIEEMARKGEVIPPKGAPFKEVIKTLLKQLKGLFTNVTFLLNCASVSIVILPVSGLVAFAPKYVENQFHFPASTANYIVGATAILTAGCGAAIGALTLYFFKNPLTKARNAALFIFIMSAVGLPFSFGYLVHCPSVEIAGVNIRNTTGINSLSCVAECNCNTSQYEPVCGADGITYASPCNAGCTARNLTDPDNPRFFDCECIAENLLGNMSSNGMASAISSNHSAVQGFCRRMEQCSLVAAFVVIIGLAIFLNYTRTVPLFFISIRCVADEERHISLAAIQFVVRAVGSIPGPLVTGAVFDSTCLLRDTSQEACGLTGNCLVYDNQALAVRSQLMLLIGTGLSAVFAFFVWFFYPRSHVGDKQLSADDETDGDTNDNASDEDGTRTSSNNDKTVADEDFSGY